MIAWPERLVPAAAEDERDAVRARDGKKAADLVGAPRVDDGVRDEPVEARVRRPRDPVDRARQDALFPDDRREIGDEGAQVARRGSDGHRHGVSGSFRPRAGAPAATRSILPLEVAQRLPGAYHS